MDSENIKKVIRPLIGDVTFIVDKDKGNDIEKIFESVQDIDDIIKAFVFDGGNM